LPWSWLNHNFTAVNQALGVATQEAALAVALIKVVQAHLHHHRTSTKVVALVASDLTEEEDSNQVEHLPKPRLRTLTKDLVAELSLIFL